MPHHPDDPCPCSSGLGFVTCCGPLLAGRAAPTAVALMRSRFTAFAVRDAEYLRATWHPSTRPQRIELDDTVWRRLQIVDTVDGGADDSTGAVEFRASFRRGAEAGLLHERSRFSRVDGSWMYVDGDIR